MHDYFSDVELIREIERRGYVVRHRSEAQRPLSWNRTAPIPAGIDFKVEAIDKLRGMITPELVRFSVRPEVPPPAKGLIGIPAVHTAELLVI